MEHGGFFKVKFYLFRHKKAPTVIQITDNFEEAL